MRLFGRKDKEKESPSPKPLPVMPEAAMPTGEPVRMTGTTTFGAKNAERLFRAHDKGDGGLLELPGWLVGEPENPADSHAIAIHVEGEKVGYLPGYLAARIQLTPDDPVPCQVQLWGEITKNKLRVIGWVAVGSEPVTWQHTLDNPPPITTEAARKAQSTAITHMVDEALTGPDLRRAKHFADGLIEGHHYLELAEPIKELKRQGRLEEALVVCYAAIEGAENAREGREPAPHYTIQAAIIHRKLGQRDQEVAVLERWLRLCPKEYREGSQANERLQRIRQKIDKG